MCETFLASLFCTLVSQQHPQFFFVLFCFLDLFFLLWSGEEDEDEGDSGPSLHSRDMQRSEMETGDFTLGP